MRDDISLLKQIFSNSKVSKKKKKTLLDHNLYNYCESVLSLKQMDCNDLAWEIRKHNLTLTF